MATLSKSSQAPSTHLVEFLANVGAHLTYEGRARSTRIQIYSNLAENTAALSMVSKGRPFTNAAFADYFKAQVGDRLQGIQLEIYVMPMKSAELGRRIKAAWAHALTSHGIEYTMKEF